MKHAGFSMDEDEATFEPAAVGDFTVDHAESGPTRAVLEGLDDAQQREVLYLLYYEDKTQAEAARELGLSPGRITQIKQTALKKIAARIDEYERR